MRMLRAYQIDRAISFYEKSLDLKQWDLQKSFAIIRKGLGFDNLHFLPYERPSKKKDPVHDSAKNNKTNFPYTNIFCNFLNFKGNDEQTGFSLRWNATKVLSNEI